MTMTVERLGDSFAARVTGLDVGSLSNAQAADLHQVATCQAVAQSTVGTQNAQHPSVTSAEMD